MRLALDSFQAADVSFQRTVRAHLIAAAVVSDNGFCKVVVNRPIPKMHAFADNGGRQYSFFVRVEYFGG